MNVCAQKEEISQQENHVMYAQQIDIESSKQLFLLVNTLTQVSLYNPFLPFDPCILCLAELFFSWEIICCSHFLSSALLQNWGLAAECSSNCRDVEPEKSFLLLLLLFPPLSSFPIRD